MNCHICFGNQLSGLRYGSVPGGARFNAVRRCLKCGAVVPVLAYR